MDRNGERTRTIPLDEDRHLTYTEYGPDSGTPIVFFHGTPGSRRLGELFESEARTNRVRLLAFDRPGYGQSSPWSDRSIQDAERFVSALLEDADVETADLIAFSGGTPYAFTTAATLPKRVGRLNIVAGTTPPSVTTEYPFTQRLLSRMAATTPRLLGGAFRVQAWLARHRAPSFVINQYTTGEPSKITERNGEIVRADFLEALANHRSGVITEFQQTATEWNIDFGNIQGDIRFWHGNNDTNVPITAVRHFASELQDGTVEVLDGADHLQTLLQSVPEILREYK